MENQDLKTKMVNNLSVRYPELHQHLLNLSAQVPDDIKVTLNEHLSKIHVSDEQAGIILQNLIDKLTAIRDSIHNKNSYTLLNDSETNNLPKPANLLLAPTNEHPIIHSETEDLPKSLNLVLSSTTKHRNVHLKHPVHKKHVSHTKKTNPELFADVEAIQTKPELLTYIESVETEPELLKQKVSFSEITTNYNLRYIIYIILAIILILTVAYFVKVRYFSKPQLQ